MRPDPHQQQTPERTDRIIYLGEVRRRRALRTRAPDHHYLASLLVVAAVAWAVWLVVFLTVAPAKLLTYLAFLAPLWLAIVATGAILTYGVEWQRGFVPSLPGSIRRGAWLASLVVANAALRFAHHWGWPVAVGMVLLAAAAEFLITERAS